MVLNGDTLEKWYINAVKLKHAFAGTTPPEPVPMPDVTTVDGLLEGIVTETHDALVTVAIANGYENTTVERAYEYQLPEKMWQWVGINMVGGYTVVDLATETMASAGVTKIVSKDADGNVLQEYTVPAEIRALPGYGLSVGQTYYNYIDFSAKKYVQKVISLTLNGTEAWGTTGTNKYFYFRFGDYKYAVAHAIISDRFTQRNIGGSNTNTGVDMINSSGSNEDRLAIRPTDYSTQDAAGFKTWLSSNNVTVHIALTTAIETDISAYLTDDIITKAVPGGTITFVNQLGDETNVPVIVDYVGKK